MWSPVGGPAYFVVLEKSLLNDRSVESVQLNRG